MSFLLSFLWGFLILGSFIGWGTAINRIAFPSDRIDWGQRAAWGLAFSVLIGAVLNSAWAVSHAAILTFVGAGLAIWILDIFRTGISKFFSISRRLQPYRNDRLALIGLVAVVVLALFQYGGWLTAMSFDPADTHVRAFNPDDDLHAYFVFPRKMLETGSMGPDPFSARRLVSSLGAQSFLHTFVLAVLPERHLNMIDPGIGMLVAVGLIFGCFGNSAASRMPAVLIAMIFLLCPVLKVNTTALLTQEALFIGLFRTMNWRGLNADRPVANGFVMALLVSALCALKSNVIPVCGIILFLSYLFRIVMSRRRARAVGEMLLVAILVGLFLLPWMISMLQSSGTMLYPLLGRGFHGSVYGSFSLPTDGLTAARAVELVGKCVTDPYVISLIMLGIAIPFCGPQWHGPLRPAMSFPISALAGTFIITIASGGNSSVRFFLPFVVATIIPMMTVPFAATVFADRRWTRGRLVALAGVLVSSALITGSWLTRPLYSPAAHLSRCVWNLRASSADLPLIPQSDIDRHAAMQQSIPAGETLFARLATPFLLDVARNPLMIVDIPGGASPPPGMPFYQGGEALADYLQSMSIRYVAYSYAMETKKKKQEYRKRLLSRYVWVRTEAAHNLDFQVNLKELGRTRMRIYDDADIFVIDLEQRHP